MANGDLHIETNHDWGYKRVYRERSDAGGYCTLELIHEELSWWKRVPKITMVGEAITIWPPNADEPPPTS